MYPSLVYCACNEWLHRLCWLLALDTNQGTNLLYDIDMLLGFVLGL